MSNPILHAFFVGRATADLIRERFESALSDFASELGKAVAELQEGWLTFADDVAQRAEREHSAVALRGSTSFNAEDLQATLDDLRAEVAQLRSELNKFRSRSA